MCFKYRTSDQTGIESPLSFSVIWYQGSSGRARGLRQLRILKHEGCVQWAASM